MNLLKSALGTTSYRSASGAALGVCIGLFVACSSWGAQDEVPITILHTNDLHSHFRSDTSPMKVGGLARIKSKVDEIRATTPNVLFVDGGDWSEGTIYYTQDAGAETARLMNRMGYDAAVIGNHDWLNGPDVLLEVLSKVQTEFPNVGHRTDFISANLSAENYARKAEFEKRVLPYTIREVQGVKVAFIGLSTYEWIYDKYFSPIKILEPFLSTGLLASRLKRENKADAVVVISHNSIKANKWVLRMAPSVDLIVGAHDHVKLTEPVEVSRLGAKPGWIVETGCWGQFLGKVNLVVEPHSKSVRLENYRLLPIDFRVPEDPEMVAEIDAFESKIEATMGRPVFHDEDRTLAAGLSMTPSWQDPLILSLVMDAYLSVSGADFALDSGHFIVGGLPKGSLRTADIFNVNPAIFNPTTRKTWPLRVMPIKGRTLLTLLNFLYLSKKFPDGARLGTAGITYTFDPLFLAAQSELLSTGFSESSTELDFFTEPSEGNLARSLSIPMVQNVKVQGKAFDPNRIYWMATGGGMVEAAQFLNTIIKNVVPLDALKTLDMENWQALETYIRQVSPITREALESRERPGTLQADLGISKDTLQWERIQKTASVTKARVQIRVKNFGYTASEAGGGSEGPFVHFLTNENGLDSGLTPEYRDLVSPIAVPALKPGESTTVSAVITLKTNPNEGLYPVTVQIRGRDSSLTTSVTEVTHWFTD